MRKVLPICLVVLAGCASAQPPAFSIRRVQSATPVIHADRVAYRIEKVSTACRTNDPMAVGAPLTRSRSARPQMAPSPGAMPNGAPRRALPYIPNACPVTAGPLAQRHVPAVLQRGESAPRAQRRP